MCSQDFRMCLPLRCSCSAKRCLATLQCDPHCLDGLTRSRAAQCPVACRGFVLGGFLHCVCVCVCVRASYTNDGVCFDL